MAVDKDFVIRNGIEVNENLIYADADTDKVGIGTTTPDKKLVVIGDTEVSSSLAVGTTITAQRGDFTGIITSHSGIDIGVGGTVLRTNTDTKKVGINSTIPRYTLDVIGPVSIGQTAEYIYGDLTVTGDIRGSSLSGQISAGGTVGFTNVTVDNTLNANNAEVYTLFRVEEFGSSKFRFTTSGDPVSIGFTQNTDNPELYLARGQHYKFDVDSGGFPFYIKTQPTADLNNIFNDGIEGNGAQVGVVTFKVPFNAPNILYYQASNTAGMGGTIYLTSNNKNLRVGILTVTDYIDGNQGNFDNIYVSGIGTINNIKSPNFSVSSGIVTALQFVGVSTGSDRVSINQKSDNINYKVIFTEHTGIASNFQYAYIDSESSQLIYNPSANILSCTRFIGNVSGIATGADNINVDQKNDNTSYQIIFSDTDGSAYQRMYIDSDNTHLTYNPSTQTFSVQNILSTNVNATTFTGDLSGTATNANFINVDKKNDNVFYQILFSDNQGAGYQRPYIDSDSGQLVYNPLTRTLSVENFAVETVSAISFSGDLSGTAVSSTNLDLQARNTTNATHYITFGTSTTGNQRLNTDTSLTYNPGTNTLSVANFSGTATNANYINVDEKSDSVAYQVLFSDNQGAGYQRPYIDSESGQFTYNPSSNTLSVGSFSGNGSSITNINGSNITSGTVSAARLPDASTSAQGVVELSNLTNGDSITKAATEKAVNDVRNIAANGSNITSGTVSAARLPDASTSAQGVVELSNLTNGDSITKAATEKAVNDVRNIAANGSNITSGTVSAARLPDASTSAQGVVQLDNTFPPTSTSTTTTITANVARQLYNTTQGQIPSGAVMLFYQASAPAGWTKITTQNDKALRVVSGSGGVSGGTISFTSAFTTRGVPLPLHNHSASSGGAGGHSHSGSTNSAGEHYHSGSTNSAGGHIHGGSTTTVGNHSHGASTDGAGGHSHGASTGGAGGHSHGVNDPGHSHSYTTSRFDDGPNDTGFIDITGDGSENQSGIINTTTTGISINAVGDHSHSVSVGAVGNHSHSVSVAAAGNHSHSLSINAAGTHSHSLSISDAGNHSHTVSTNTVNNHSHSVSVSNAGTSGASMDFNVQYIDVILAQKN